MKVMDAAKKLGVTTSEVIKKLNDPEINHHFHVIPEGRLPDLGIVPEDTQEPEPVVEKPKPKKSDELELPAGVTPEQVWHACTGIGSKHPLWKYKELGRKPGK